MQFTSGQLLVQEQIAGGARQAVEGITKGGGTTSDSIGCEETLRGEAGTQTTRSLVRESSEDVKKDGKKSEREQEPLQGEKMEWERLVIEEERLENKGLERQREEVEREGLEREQLEWFERERLEIEREERERVEKESFEKESLEKKQSEWLERERLEREISGKERSEEFERIERERERKEVEDRVTQENLVLIKALEAEEASVAETARITEVSVAEEKRSFEEHHLAELQAAHMAKLAEQVVAEEAHHMEEESLCEERLCEEERLRAKIEEDHRLDQVREQERAVEQKHMVAKYHASLAAAAAAAAAQAVFQARLTEGTEQTLIAEEHLTEEDNHIITEGAAENALIEIAKFPSEKEEKQPLVEELKKEIDESEKRRLELELIEVEQKQREEALKQQLQELMEQRERHMAVQQEQHLMDACYIPLPEDEGGNATLTTVNTDSYIAGSVIATDEQRRDRRRARSLQRREREVSPVYIAESRQRSLEREHMREEERRKEVENVRQAFGLGEIAAHPKPDNWADLIDNDSDAYDEILPPPPPNLADLVDGPDGIVELDVEDIPEIKIEEAPRTGLWVAPWPIPRLIETVPTPMPGQQRGQPRVFVEGTGFMDGKRQSRPPSRSSDRAPSPTLVVPAEGYDYIVYAQDAPALELLLSTEQGQTVQTNEQPCTLQPVEASTASTKPGCHEEILEAEVSPTNDSIGRNIEIATTTPILSVATGTDLDVEVFPNVRFHCVPRVERLLMLIFTLI